MEIFYRVQLVLVGPGRPENTLFGNGEGEIAFPIGAEESDILIDRFGERVAAQTKLDKTFADSRKRQEPVLDIGSQIAGNGVLFLF
jgi:hypothetical protein